MRAVCVVCGMFCFIGVGCLLVACCEGVQKTSETTLLDKVVTHLETLEKQRADIESPAPESEEPPRQPSACL